MRYCILACVASLVLAFSLMCTTTTNTFESSIGFETVIEFEPHGIREPHDFAD